MAIKVKILETRVLPSGMIKKDDEVSLENDLAKQLIKQGVAKEAKSKEKKRRK